MCTQRTDFTKGQHRPSGHVTLKSARYDAVASSSMIGRDNHDAVALSGMCACVPAGRVTFTCYTFFTPIQISIVSDCAHTAHTNTHTQSCTASFLTVDCRRASVAPSVVTLRFEYNHILYDKCIAVRGAGVFFQVVAVLLRIQVRAWRRDCASTRARG